MCRIATDSTREHAHTHARLHPPPPPHRHAPAVRAPAKIMSVDWAAALDMPGVVDYVDNADAPHAQGSFAPGESLFVPGGESLFAGHPVGCIIAKSRRCAGRQPPRAETCPLPC